MPCLCLLSVLVHNSSLVPSACHNYVPSNCAGAASLTSSVWEAPRGTWLFPVLCARFQHALLFTGSLL